MYLGTVPNTLDILTDLILTTVARDRHNDYPHFTIKDTEHRQVKEFGQTHKLDSPHPRQSEARLWAHNC